MTKLNDKIQTTRKSRSVRFSDDEWQRLEAISSVIGLNTAEFVRSSALERARKLEDARR